MRMRLLFNAHLQMDFVFMFSVTQDLYNFYRFLCQYAYWETNIATALFSTQSSFIEKQRNLKGNTERFLGATLWWWLRQWFLVVVVVVVLVVVVSSYSNIVHFRADGHTLDFDKMFLKKDLFVEQEASDSSINLFIEYEQACDSFHTKYRTVERRVSSCITSMLQKEHGIWRQHEICKDHANKN